MQINLQFCDKGISDLSQWFSAKPKASHSTYSTSKEVSCPRKLPHSLSMVNESFRKRACFFVDERSEWNRCKDHSRHEISSAARSSAYGSLHIVVVTIRNSASCSFCLRRDVLVRLSFSTDPSHRSIRFFLNSFPADGVPLSIEFDLALAHGRFLCQKRSRRLFRSFVFGSSIGRFAIENANQRRIPDKSTR